MQNIIHTNFSHSFNFKKHVILSLSMIMFLLSSCNHPVNFKGTITGIENDTVFVFIYGLNHKNQFRRDTVVAQQNHFELQVPNSPTHIKLAFKPKGFNGKLKMISKHPIYFLPGDHMKVEGNMDSIHVSGTELYKDLEQFKDISLFEKELETLNEQKINFYRQKNKQALDSIQNIQNSKYELYLEALMNTIRENPDNLAASILVTRLTPKKGLEALDLLSDNIKEGILKNFFLRVKNEYEEALRKEEIKPGKVAPDFDVTTFDGKKVTLSTFKGKYLLLDFWSSWCNWCVRDIPDMKKYYAKYKDKIEFLGISNGVVEKDWKESITKNKLPWPNVLGDATDIAVIYAITGIPTKILIDPNGIIVQVFVGETPDSYKKLDELFK